MPTYTNKWDEYAAIVRAWIGDDDELTVDEDARLRPETEHAFAMQESRSNHKQNGVAHLHMPQRNSSQNVELR